MATFLDSPSFKLGTARRLARGAIQWDESGGLTVEDTWAAVMPDGAPPVGFAVGKSVRANVAGGFPARGSAHPEYGDRFRADSIRWEPDAHESRVWRATVRYKYRKRTTDRDGVDGTGVVDVDFYSNSVAVPVNLVNSAGEPFSPVPMREVASPCVRIAAVTRHGPSHFMQFMGAVNSARVTICGIDYPPYTARCMATVTKRDDEDRPGLYDAVIDIQGNFTPAPDDGKVLVRGQAVEFSSVFGRAGGQSSPLLSGWALLIPNAGYCYKKDGALVRFKVGATETMVDGRPEVVQDSPVPKFLAADGSELAAGDPVLYWAVPPGPAVPFAGLGLPREW